MTHQHFGVSQTSCNWHWLQLFTLFSKSVPIPGHHTALLVINSSFLMFLDGHRVGIPWLPLFLLQKLLPDSPRAGNHLVLRALHSFTWTASAPRSQSHPKVKFLTRESIQSRVESDWHWLVRLGDFPTSKWLHLEQELSIAFREGVICWTNLHLHFQDQACTL